MFRAQVDGLCCSLSVQIKEWKVKISKIKICSLRLSLRLNAKEIRTTQTSKEHLLYGLFNECEDFYLFCEILVSTPCVFKLL